MSDSFAEEVIPFRCEDSELVGILHKGDAGCMHGVILIVGGDQYRTGPHRQLLKLARFLAAHGFWVFRFDYRGMGDSGGARRSFDAIQPDIKSAMDTFFERVPNLTRATIWGLCDAASAAIFYASSDVRISRVILVNPWITTDHTAAVAHMKHYYLAHLCTRSFWSNLLTGSMNKREALQSLFTNIRQSLKPQTGQESNVKALPNRVFSSIENFKGNILIILSEHDLTAKVFEDSLNEDRKRSNLLNLSTISLLHVAGADHTFSKEEWHRQLEELTLDWVQQTEAWK